MTDDLNLTSQITETEGVLRISASGALQMLLEIEISITSFPGYRLRHDILAERVGRGIRVGDVVRWGDSLVKYHGNGNVTVTHRRWDSRQCELVETRCENKVLTARQSVELLRCAAIEAHANAINAPDGAHHAFTGVAYNPASRP